MQLRANQAQGDGLSSGNPHQVNHTVSEAVGGDHESVSSSDGEDQFHHQNEKKTAPIPFVGEGLQARETGLWQSYRRYLRRHSRCEQRDQ